MNKLIEREEKFNKIMRLAERIGDVDAVLERLANRIEDFEDYEDEITDLQDRVDNLEYDCKDMDEFIKEDDIQDYIESEVDNQLDRKISDYIDYNDMIHEIGCKLAKAY